MGAVRGGPEGTSDAPSHNNRVPPTQPIGCSGATGARQGGWWGTDVKSSKRADPVDIGMCAGSELLNVRRQPR